MSTPLRFTKSFPCPICGGHDGLARGQGIRCFGFLSGNYARCTREEHSGKLAQNRDGTYSHRLEGDCLCGQPHGISNLQLSHNGTAKHTRARPQQRFRSFFTVKAFLRRRYGEGCVIRFWSYHDAEGGEAFRVLRIDYPAADGNTAKSYRPCHKADDGRWLLSRPAAPLPLYNLPAILAAPEDAVILILEGEKCTDIATALGFTYATTSAHGAQAPWLTDWSPLAGRAVAIVRDTGDSGETYAARVATLLAALDPPAGIRVITLPGLSDGEDIEQFIDARRRAGRNDDEILSELQGLIGAHG
jgi:hypothetical protein